MAMCLNLNELVTSSSFFIMRILKAKITDPPPPPPQYSVPFSLSHLSVLVSVQLDGSNYTVWR